MSDESRVVIDDPQNMSLLGLMLGSLIERQTKTAAAQKRLGQLKGALVVEAGKMAVTLTFDGGKMTVSSGAAAKPRAAVKGSMQALMDISLGGGMVGPWLAGRIRTKGNLFMLLKLMPLMKV